MKKILFAVLGVVVILGGAGGTWAYLHFHSLAKSAKPAPPKPIYFAHLDNLVVSVPADSTGQSGQAYVQFSVEFASTDPQAVAAFTNLQPIITAQVINLLMSQNAAQLMNPAAHTALAKNCLDIANGVLNKSAAYSPPNPFSAAYITNIVQQD